MCDENAHPHSSDAAGQFVVVHNGAIENHRELRQILQTASDGEGRGMTLRTETDTEVIAALALFIWEGSGGKMGFR